MAQTQQIPWGKTKGVPITEADEKDIRGCMSRMLDSLAEDPEHKFAESNRRWIAGAREELLRRGVDPKDMPGAGGGATAPRQANGTGRAAQPARAAAPQTSAMQHAPAPQGQMMIGSFGDGAAATAALAKAASEYHLVAPTTIAGRLPEGCEIAISLVYVDPYGPEVYAITGNRKDPKPDDTVGLDRVALAKIGAAAGVTWLTSHRTDDGSHPHYCAWEAVGRFPNFDMTTADVPGNVAIDTREDGEISGPDAQEIRMKQRESSDGGDKQLLELRKFITRHAESKAMNRALANRGVRRSYKRKDLEKAFAVAKLMFTGHSEDPEARKEFRQMIGQRFLGASNALYGAAPTMQIPAPQPMAYLAPPAQAYAQPPAHSFHAPPPLTSNTRGVVDDPYGHEEEDQPYAEAPEKPVAPPAAPSSQQELKT